MISSPVSRLSVAARSYLTSMMILILVLVAIHFSIQARGQQQAEQWLAAWAEKSGSQASEVRLHMLRGALAVQDMHWESNGVRFYSPFVLLRGNLSSSIQQVDIREVVLKGAEVQISNNIFHDILQKKATLAHVLTWAALLDDVREVHADDLAIKVEARQNSLPLKPMLISHASFSSTSKQHEWVLSGDVWGGHIYIKGEGDTQRMAWSNINASILTTNLGLTQVAGDVSGHIKSQGKQLSGDIVWHRTSGDMEKNDIYTGNLTFDGTLEKQRWQGNVTSLNWPLQIFSDDAPILQHRRLQRAYLTGTIHFEHDKHGWQASMGKGSLQHLDYRSESKAIWYLKKINFQKTILKWPQKTLHIDAMDIEYGSWAVDSYRASHTDTDTAWRVSFPKVSFKAMKLGDVGKHIWLPDVQGKLSWHDQKVNMIASSNSKAMGEWSLEARGTIDKKLNLKVYAKHVPLIHFRDALPRQFVKNARLNGEVAMDLNGFWDKQGWHLHGDMDGQNIMWNRGAWLWRAEYIQLKNIIFSTTQMPHADVCLVHNWSGQSSLTPWIQVRATNTTQQLNTAPLTLDGWQLAHISIGYGKFSLGQEDAVWFESNMVNIDNIEANKVATMQVMGRLAEGRFTLQGDWFPWGTSPWVSLQASLKQALPFAAAPWLQLSGLPIVTRGRISANIKVRQNKAKPHYYQGHMLIHITHAALQEGVISNQNLLQTTGYEPYGLFERISNGGDIRLDIPLQGNWVYTPLNLRVLGRGLLSALANKAELGVGRKHEKSFIYLSNIRLHDSLDGRKDSLKHNERVRLRKVMRALKQEKTWLLELRPQLGQESLSQDLIQRVRKTQEQITAFLVARGISPSRIFPVWPEEGNRQGESTGILIQAVK